MKTHQIKTVVGIALSFALAMSGVASANWVPMSKSEMTSLTSFPGRATLGKDSTEKALLFVFCGEGIMLSHPNWKDELIKSVVVDGKNQEIGLRLASVVTVIGVESAFKRGATVRINGSKGSVFDFSLIGFTKARNKTC